MADPAAARMKPAPEFQLSRPPRPSFIAAPSTCAAPRPPDLARPASKRQYVRSRPRCPDNPLRNSRMLRNRLPGRAEAELHGRVCPPFRLRGGRSVVLEPVLTRPGAAAGSETGGGVRGVGVNSLPVRRQTAGRPDDQEEPGSVKSKRPDEGMLVVQSVVQSGTIRLVQAWICIV
mgnify:CR=1 FL=1